MTTPNPWRHVSKMQLKNMVSTATRQWEKAIRGGDTIKAQQIEARLAPVSEALDGMTN